MYTKFLSLDPEKQQRIINAAIKEFAQKGYDDASTNSIVKEAGISKGLLFHYFKNKKDLFLFLYDYATEVIVKEFYGRLRMDEKDLFKRLRQIFILEYELFQKYPGMYDFYRSTVLFESSEIKSELADRFQELEASGFKVIFEGLDFSVFKEGIDLDKAFNIMKWSIDGLLGKLGFRTTNLFSGDRATFDQILSEIDKYVEFFKKCFYK